MCTAQCAGSMPAAAAWTRAILHPGVFRWLTLLVHILHPAALSSLMCPHPLLGGCELLGVRLAALWCLPAIEYHYGHCWGAAIGPVTHHSKWLKLEMIKAINIYSLLVVCCQRRKNVHLEKIDLYNTEVVASKSHAIFQKEWMSMLFFLFYFIF